MREKILSHSTVVEVLQPFLVTAWHGSHETPMPADIREIYRSSKLRNENNMFCFVLNSQSRLVRSFYAFPGKTPGALGASKDGLANNFKSEITKALTQIRLPREKFEHELRLPDVDNGVRIFIRAQGRRDRFDVDTIVKTVTMDAQDWRTLSYKRASRKINAAELKKWFSHLHPDAKRGAPAIELLNKIDGILTLDPAGSDSGARYALLRGKIQLSGTGRSGH